MSDGEMWGVYDVYCMKCAHRWVGIASVAAEAVELWMCPRCDEMTATWHPYGDDADDIVDGDE